MALLTPKAGVNHGRLVNIIVLQESFLSASDEDFFPPQDWLVLIDHKKTLRFLRIGESFFDSMVSKRVRVDADDFSKLHVLFFLPVSTKCRPYPIEEKAVNYRLLARALVSDRLPLL